MATARQVSPKCLATCASACSGSLLRGVALQVVVVQQQPHKVTQGDALDVWGRDAADADFAEPFLQDVEGLLPI
jgi:hypothetical protein